MKLKKADLEMIPIVLPPLSEQQELIKVLEEVSNMTETLQARVKRAGQQVSAWRERLLGV